MKKLFQLIICLLLIIPAMGQQQHLNVGTNANDHTGDPLRTAMQKIEHNMNELYMHNNIDSIPWYFLVDKIVLRYLGKVGIGVINPDSLLDVNGGAKFKNDILVNGLHIGNKGGLTNFFVGNGWSNTTGTYNVFIGNDAGARNTTGSNNVFCGTGAGGGNVIGEWNAFYGINAGNYNLGSRNTYLGIGAGATNLTGNNNTMVGVVSGHANLSGMNNIFIGAYSGYNELGSNKIYVGIPSLPGTSWPNDTTTTPIYINGNDHNGYWNQNLIVPSIQEYTNNAAAIYAGLKVGTFYRTGDILKVVHN